MKVPEKIYLHPDDDVMGEILSQKEEGDIEYIRTDIFAKKVCEWLKENWKDYIITDIDNKYEGVDALFLKDFRKYMKGE